MSAVTAHCLELLERLAEAHPEDQASALDDIVFAFGQFVSGGALHEKTLEQLLQQARSLSEDVTAVDEIISSSLEKGQNSPGNR